MNLKDSYRECRVESSTIVKTENREQIYNFQDESGEKALWGLFVLWGKDGRPVATGEYSGASAHNFFVSPLNLVVP